MKLGVHEDALCLAFLCDEPMMGALPAGAKGVGGSARADDSVEVWLGPDHGAALQFVVGASGARGGAAESMQLRAATARLADAWTAEMEIPLRALHAQAPEPGDVWGIQLCRSRRTGGKTQNTTWTPTTGGFRKAECFGDLVFAPETRSAALPVHR